MNAREEIAYHLWTAVPSSDNAEAKTRAQEMLDAYRAEVLREALAAVEGERLHDDTNHPEDKAYGQAIDDAVTAVSRLTDTELEVVPLMVSRFDTAMEPALEEEQIFIVGAIAEDGRPVALRFDRDDRRKVAQWLAPETVEDEDFFQKDRTYTRTDRHHGDLRFVCVAPTVDPQTGEREAWGWLHREDGTRRMERKWVEEYPNWTAVDGGDRHV